MLPVTVVIPAYRRPDEVRRAVASVAAQTAPPSEVVVVDDASGDDTADAARAAGAHVIALDVNAGEGGARNHGVAAAGQPWIALLDSDDEWLPTHLERLWTLRGQHVVVGAACLAVGNGPAAGRIYGWRGPGARLLRHPTDIVWPENVLTPSGTLCRRNALQEAGGFPLRTPLAGDLDTWLRLLEQGTGLASPHVGVRYHLHASQASRDRRAMYAARIDVYERYRGRPWFDKRLVRRMAAADAWDLRDAGLLAPALAHPQGVVGLTQTLVHRYRKRRRRAGLG